MKNAALAPASGVAEKKERQKTDNPREGWEIYTALSSESFSLRVLILAHCVALSTGRWTVSER